MYKVLFLVAVAILLKMTGGSPLFMGRQLIDLTHYIDEDTMPKWPGEVWFKRHITHNGTTEDGFWLSIYSFCSTEHLGTHMDSPNHYREDGWKLDEIPLERFMAPAAVVNVADKTKNNPDYLLTEEDLKNWEAVNGRIPDNSVLLINFGWAQYWTNQTAYMGADLDKNATFLHFPGVGGPAAKWLIDNKRDIWGFGSDVYSTDYGQATKDGLFPAHKYLFSNNIYTLENVANLDALPTKGSTLFVFPLRMRGGTGSPIRAFAVLDDEGEITTNPNSAGKRTGFASFWLTCFILLIFF